MVKCKLNNSFFVSITLLLSSCVNSYNMAISTPTLSITPTQTLSPTPTKTPIPSITPTKTVTPTNTLTPTPTHVLRPTLAMEGIISFSILHINDFHARLLPEDDNGFIPGAARLAFFIKSYREKIGKNKLLLFDAGDLIEGTEMMWPSKGQPVLDFINSIGAQAGVIGNHDFWYGEDRVIEILSQRSSGFRFIAANIYKREKNSKRCSLDLLTDPYLIFDVGENEGPKVRVAVIGMVSTEYPQWLVDTNKICIPIKPIDALGKFYNRIKDKEKADIIIVLSHNYFEEDVSFAQIAKDRGMPVDIIINGHDHESINSAKVIGTTYIVTVGEFGKLIGVFDLTFNRATHKLIVKWQPYKLYRSSPEDPTTIKLLENIIQ